MLGSIKSTQFKEKTSLYKQMKDFCSCFKHKLGSISQKTRLVSLYISSKCILIQRCLDICIGKQKKNTAKDTVHATFNATTMNLRLSAPI